MPKTLVDWQVCQQCQPTSGVPGQVPFTKIDFLHQLTKTIPCLQITAKTVSFPKFSLFLFKRRGSYTVVQEATFLNVRVACSYKIWLSLDAWCLAP